VSFWLWASRTRARTRCGLVRARRCPGENALRRSQDRWRRIVAKSATSPDGITLMIGWTIRIARFLREPIELSELRFRRQAARPLSAAHTGCGRGRFKRLYGVSLRHPTLSR
jgi:hypothetical protein